MRIRDYDPTNCIEVSDVLPTATGEYLEAVRKAVQDHIKNIVCPEIQHEYDDYGEGFEVLGGTHPYRDARIVPAEFIHPFNSWFWK